MTTNAQEFGFQAGFQALALVPAGSSDVQPLQPLDGAAVPLRGALHLGHGCHVPGGCDSRSPSTPELHFVVTAPDALLRCRLWRRTPADDAESHDVSVEIHCPRPPGRTRLGATPLDPPRDAFAGAC